MRHIILRLFLFAMAALFLNISHAQYFELNAPASSSSSIIKLFELNGYVYAQISTGAGSVISKYDVNGNQVAVNNQNYTGGPAGQLKELNGKLFTMGMYDNCDNYDGSYFINRINQNLMLEKDFMSSSIGNSPFQFEWMNYYGVKFTPVNDSVMVVISGQKLAVVDIEHENYLFQTDHTCGDVEIDKLETSSEACVIYGNSGIYLFENDTIIQTSEQPTIMLKQMNGMFYTSGEGLKKLDSDFSVLATYPITASDIVIYDGNIHISRGDSIYVFDEDLNLLSNGQFYDNGNFAMYDFTVFNDQYFVGGANGVTQSPGNATFVLRNYSLDFETEEFHQDIGISNIELTGYQFLPGSVFNGMVMNYNLNLSLDVTLENYSSSPVSSAKILWNSYPYNPMGACISSTYFLSAGEIPPNSSAVFHINNLFYRNQSSPGNGNSSTFELCLTSHAPDAKVDDDRSNDRYCKTLSVLFVGLDEIYAQPFKWFYNASMDQIELMEIEDCAVSLYSSSGQLLNTYNLMKGTHQLSMSALAAGMYLLRMDVGNSSQIMKLVKH
jgi:hypothetical protein